MKPVYPFFRKKKIGKSKIDIDFQFLFLNWKLNGRMTHGPNCTVIYCILISGLVSFPLWSPEKNLKIDHRFSSFRKIKIWNRFSFFIFLCSGKIKIEHRFSFIIFLCLEKNENWKSIVDFYFSFLNLKKMKIEHRFSFFIFQLSEKMNDPNIHAFRSNCKSVKFLLKASPKLVRRQGKVYLSSRLKRRGYFSGLRYQNRV